MKSRRDLSSEQKIVAEGFIGNIARVIRRERVKKNLSQEELASMVGVDRSMISNYENEKADITASLMANISVACEFPMDEYVKITGLIYDDSQPVDVLFKKLVASSDQEMGSAARIDDGLPKKPRLIFNREKWEWEMDNSRTVSDSPGKSFFSMPTAPDSEDDRLFNEYMNSSRNRKKLELLKNIAELIDYDYVYGMPSTVIMGRLVKAVLNYVASDTEKAMNKWLKAYLKACKYNA